MHATPLGLKSEASIFSFFDFVFRDRINVALQRGLEPDNEQLRKAVAEINNRGLGKALTESLTEGAKIVVSVNPAFKGACDVDKLIQLIKTPAKTLAGEEETKLFQQVLSKEQTQAIGLLKNLREQYQKRINNAK